jgi:hypothetical protein
MGSFCGVKEKINTRKDRACFKTVSMNVSKLYEKENGITVKTAIRSLY